MRAAKRALKLLGVNATSKWVLRALEVVLNLSSLWLAFMLLFWVRPRSCSCFQLRDVTCCYERLHAVACSHVLLHAVTCSCMPLHSLPPRCCRCYALSASHEATLSDFFTPPFLPLPWRQVREATLVTYTMGEWGRTNERELICSHCASYGSGSSSGSSSSSLSLGRRLAGIDCTGETVVGWNGVNVSTDCDGVGAQSGSEEAGMAFLSIALVLLMLAPYPLILSMALQVIQFSSIAGTVTEIDVDVMHHLESQQEQAGNYVQAMLLIRKKLEHSYPEVEDKRSVVHRLEQYIKLAEMYWRYRAVLSEEDPKDEVAASSTRTREAATLLAAPLYLLPAATTQRRRGARARARPISLTTRYGTAVTLAL